MTRCVRSGCLVSLGLLLLGYLAAYWWLPETRTLCPPGLMCNGGRSLPQVLFRCRRWDPTMGLSRGAFVYFLPNQNVQAIIRQIAPTEPPARPQIKQVAAVAGETVCWEVDQWFVNGQDAGPLALTWLYGLSHPEGCLVVPGGTIMVRGTHPRSLDSRYTGPMALSEVVQQCRALF